MKGAVRSPAFRRKRQVSRNGSASGACGLKAGLRTDFPQEVSVANKTIDNWLFRISLVFLASCAGAAQSPAQGAPQNVRGSGPPVVTITQVTESGGAGQKRSFQVQWTTQKPPLTTILKYDVSL